MTPELSMRQIFDEHARYVIRTLRHLGVSDADVDDVAQEVFVTVHRKLPEFEGRSKLRTWLYAICLRIASDHRRRAYMVRERVTDSPPIDTGERTGDEPDTTLESRSFVRELLADLRRRQARRARAVRNRRPHDARGRGGHRLSVADRVLAAARGA